MKMKIIPSYLFILLLFYQYSFQEVSAQSVDKRGRCRDYGINPGILETGQWNAISDVAGVKVGSVTVWEGEDVRTGVTVILPHDGNIFQEKVPAAIYIGNGFGKAMGFLQIEELGTLETPISLTNTLNVGLVADAIVEYTLQQKGNESVRSVNAVVGETNDGYLNNIRKRSIKKEHVFQAIEKVSSGGVEEGSIGAGTATRCFGFKGGIGTSSRILPKTRGGYTVGVIVQSNFGGVLTIDGMPIGEELGSYYMKKDIESQEEGSCMIVVATDAPVSPRNLKRMAKRAMLGLSRTGGFASNGSGDFVIAFSTVNKIPYESKTPVQEFTYLRNDQMSPLFLAVVEATEEAIYNSLFKATSVCGTEGNCVESLPIEKVIKICQKYNLIK